MTFSQGNCAKNDVSKLLVLGSKTFFPNFKFKCKEKLA